MEITATIRIDRRGFGGSLTWGAGPAAAVQTAEAEAAEPARLIESPLRGRLDGWLVAVGSTLVSGRPVCVIETADGLQEIETKLGGTVARLLVEAGETVALGQPLLALEAAP